MDGATASRTTAAMLDAHLRPLIDPPLDRVALMLARRGIGADQVTLAGFACAVLAALAIALEAPLLGLVLIGANRIADGLDGALARLSAPTDRGAFLDITLDFVFYALIPLAFALADPAANALAAAVLLATFLANGTAFLAFAALAARRGLETQAQGAKSIYYAAGLAGGTETIIAFALMCVWPAAFGVIASGFAILCAVSAAGRIVAGWDTFGR
jgi:phosphatidylglycerophosphate synthase